MLCDMIIAGENARFGQPEINLGVIPGIGGSQRLTRAVGKAKAMDLILTGRQMKVDEAEKLGLVSRVVPTDEVVSTAREVAATIASIGGGGGGFGRDPRPHAERSTGVALSGLQVYKLLPKTNCKDCGFPTCMAFAMQLAAGKVELEKCPHVAEEIAAELGEAAAPPVRRRPAQWARVRRWRPGPRPRAPPAPGG